MGGSWVREGSGRVSIAGAGAGSMGWRLRSNEQTGSFGLSSASRIFSLNGIYYLVRLDRGAEFQGSFKLFSILRPLFSSLSLSLSLS